MAFMKTDIDIDGVAANLSAIFECFAVIHGVGLPRVPGTRCDFTAVARIMGRDVPVRFNGEIVQAHGDVREVMFCSPTHNWPRILRFLDSPRNDATLH